MGIPRTDSCVSEVERGQMTWAEQVDLAYPLEECWSERCLSEPHLCMEDHHRPEVRSGEEKLDSWYLPNGDPFALMKVKGKAERVVNLDTTRAGLTYPLQECWSERCQSESRLYEDYPRRPDVWSDLDSWYLTLAYDDPYALMKVERKAERVVNLDTTQGGLTYPLQKCWSERCQSESRLYEDYPRRPDVWSDLDSWYLTLAYDDPYALMKVERKAERVVNLDTTRAGLA